jgi:hypothetical protein
MPPMEPTPTDRATRPGAPAVSRWEWRTFDYQPQRWQEVLRNGVRSTAGSLRTETYLITPETRYDVTIRDDRIEARELVGSDHSGLEMWRATITAPFPLASGVLAELCAMWRCPEEVDHPNLPTPEHLLAFLQRHMPEVTIVPCRKWRRAYRIHGCRAERATVLAGGELLETLSLEHEDPDVLLEALRNVRLDRERNTSYVIVMKQSLGWIGEATHTDLAGVGTG